MDSPLSCPDEIVLEPLKTLRELDDEINAKIIKVQLQLQKIRDRFMDSMPDIIASIKSQDESITDNGALHMAEEHIQHQFNKAHEKAWILIWRLREEQKVRHDRILNPQPHEPPRT